MKEFNLSIVIVAVSFAASVFLLFQFEESVFYSVNLEQEFATPENENVNPDVSLVFVGDIMLARAVGQRMEIENDFYWPFRLLGDYVRDFDLAVGNLESVISDKGANVGSIYSFRADPRVASPLASAGFDILSVANNHAWDYGRAAFEDSLNRIKTNGMDYVGGGFNFDEAHGGLIKEVNGTKIAFLAYTNLAPNGIGAALDQSGISVTDLEHLEKDVKALKEKSDVVAVLFHWGEEYQTVHNSYQETVAKKAIAAGADIVVGHHPHVRQEITREGESWIAYSLGNFIFDQSFSMETMTGLALEVEIRDKKITEVSGKNMVISPNFQVYPEGVGQ